MKKILFLMIAIFMIPISCFAIVSISNNSFVTDEADILKEETENYMIRYSNFIFAKKKVRYYVVTVSSLEGYTLADYSNYLFQSLHIGKKGALILFSKQERVVQVTFGDELGKCIEEEEIEDYIHRYFMPYFQNSEWNKGMKNGYISFYKRICDYYHIDSSVMELVDGNALLIKYRYPILMALLLLGMGFCYMFSNFFQKIYKHKKKSFTDYILFSITIFTNILLLIGGYLMEPWFLLILLGVEAFALLTILDTSNMSLEDAFKKIRMDEYEREKRKKKKKMMNRKRKS